MDEEAPEGSPQQAQQVERPVSRESRGSSEGSRSVGPSDSAQSMHAAQPKGQPSPGAQLRSPKADRPQVGPALSVPARAVGLWRTPG